jgi:hypothetical protein
VTKDLAMLVYGRDGRLGPRIKHLFQVSSLNYVTKAPQITRHACIIFENTQFRVISLKETVSQD